MNSSVVAAACVMRRGRSSRHVRRGERHDWRVARPHSAVQAAHNRDALSAVLDLELVKPPNLIDQLGVDVAKRAPDDGPFDALAHQQRLGIIGSSDGASRPIRPAAIENLVNGGSSREDGVTEPRRMCDVWEICNRLHMRFGSRLLADERWCCAWARSAAAAATARMRVIVLGLGSGTPALAAARSGAEVLWVVRVSRFAEVARQLVARNGIGGRVRVMVCKQWASLPAQLPPMPSGGKAREAHAIFTEEIGDDPISEGLLPLARLSHSLLLRPGGTFAPGRLRVQAVLASVRTGSCCGFDLRAFNVFRNSAGAV